MDQSDAPLPASGDDGPDLDDGRLSTAAAPAVVAVVVTHDPGVWFEEALGSLVEQDYPNLSILVVDSGSATDPTARIAEVAPKAFVHRVEENIGPGRAVNLALGMVEGTAFFLVCHDDVALAPSAVRMAVEEAYRSNAGIVGPKLVRWDQPQALLSVGMGCDRFGMPSPLCERGELDQEQHDGVRDVFFVPGACFLARADLLRALGGFDEDMSFHGEDTDLCWRAHLAGARVLVAPAARVRHVEALGDRRPDDRRRLQSRHRLRMVLTNYGWFHLIGEGLQQALLSLIEVVVALLTGRTRQAADTAAAWVWNLRRTRSILAKRRRVRRVRQVTDLELRSLHVRGSARLTAFARGQLGAGEGATGSLADAGREWLSSQREGIRRENVVIALATVVVVGVGSRHLLTQPLPAVAELTPFPDRARDLLAAWWSGWRETGLGAPSFAPLGLGVFGLVGFLLAGATGLVRWLAVLGMLPLGFLGAWRLGAVQPHSRAKAATLLAYGANPLPYNALAAGSWRGLVLYASLPWIVLRLARAAGLAPYADGSDSEPAVVGHTVSDVLPVRPGVIRHVAAAGLITAGAALVYPAAPLVVAGVAGALVLGSLLAGQRTGTGRLALAGVVSCLVGLVLHAPTWYDTLWRSGGDTAVGGRFGSAGGRSLSSLAHFDTGLVGSSPLTWGLLVAGLLGLAIGRAWRLTWAVRAWTLVALPLALVAAVQGGWWDVELPGAEVLLAPAALGVALAVGMGMAAFDVDLPVYRFGWRQFASVGAALSLGVASLPVLVATVDGRWRMPRGGHDRVLAFLDAEQAETGPFRVLWLGAPGSLPVAGWSLASDRSAGATAGSASFATTIGYPDTSALWRGPDNAALDLVPDLIGRARAGGANRLGRELGTLGVRYIIVLDRSAPTPFEAIDAPAPAWIDATLAGQLDLQEVDLNGALRMYRNTAWRPMAVAVPPEVDRAAQLPLEDAASTTPALELDATPQLSGSGVVDPDTTLHVAETADPGWSLTVEGQEVPRGESFGWANRFGAADGGSAELRFATSLKHRLVLVVQLLAWVAVAALALRRRSLWTPRRVLRTEPDVVILDEPAERDPDDDSAAQALREDEPLVDDPFVLPEGAATTPTIDADRADAEPDADTEPDPDPDADVDVDPDPDPVLEPHRDGPAGGPGEVHP